MPQSELIVPWQRTLVASQLVCAVFRALNLSLLTPNVPAAVVYPATVHHDKDGQKKSKGVMACRVGSTLESKPHARRSNGVSHRLHISGNIVCLLQHLTPYPTKLLSTRLVWLWRAPVLAVPVRIVRTASRSFQPQQRASIASWILYLVLRSTDLVASQGTVLSLPLPCPSLTISASKRPVNLFGIGMASNTEGLCYRSPLVAWPAPRNGICFLWPLSHGVPECHHTVSCSS